MRTLKLWHSRLSSEQIRRLLEHFVAGTPARTAAELAEVNRNTATYFYHRLRELIAAQLARSDDASESGEVEVHESHLGCVGHGKGHNAQRSAPVLGLLTRGGKIHTSMVADTRSDTLTPILRGNVNPDSLVYTSGKQVSDVLDRLGMRYQKVNNKDRFTRGPVHTNGIENFWNQSRRHLRKYNGIPAQHLHLYIKECEWRYNYGPAGQLLKTLEGWLTQP